MGYTNKTFACPFFLWDEKLKIHCEGGCRVVFRDRTGAMEYIDLHCGDVKGWEDCSVAKSLLRYYDRLDEAARPRAVNG